MPIVLDTPEAINPTLVAEQEVTGFSVNLETMTLDVMAEERDADGQAVNFLQADQVSLLDAEGSLDLGITPGLYAEIKQVAYAALAKAGKRRTGSLV